MLNPYLGVLILGVVGVSVGVLILVLTHLIGSRRPTATKASPYESGIVPLGGTHERFSVNFYIVAMLFIVLDIETLFLIPWATIVRQLGITGFIEMSIFLLVLGVGLAYAWRQGALEWE